MTAGDLVELVAVVLVGLYVGIVTIAGGILLIVAAVGRVLDRAGVGRDDTVDPPTFWPYPDRRAAALEAAVAAARYGEHRDNAIVAAAIANLDDELVALLANPNPEKDTEP